jgi:hypothetical protein
MLCLKDKIEHSYQFMFLLLPAFDILHLGVESDILSGLARYPANIRHTGTMFMDWPDIRSNQYRYRIRFSSVARSLRLSQTLLYIHQSTFCPGLRTTGSLWTGGPWVCCSTRCWRAGPPSTSWGPQTTRTRTQRTISSRYAVPVRYNY